MYRSGDKFAWKHSGGCNSDGPLVNADVQVEWINDQARTFEGLESARGDRLLLQSSGNLSGTTDNNSYLHASVAKHGNQGVDTESIDLPAHKVADARLRDPEELGGLGLCQATRLDQFTEVNHQVGPHLEVGRLFLGESKIAEDITS